MNKPVIDRRQMILTGTAAVLTSLIGTATARAAAKEQTSIIRRSASPVRPARRPYDFDLFYDLSRYITARSDLDRRVARTHFEHFRKEEWGWHIAARLYATIHNELDDGLASVPELLASGRLPDLDQWFAQHMLDAWYEGFYRYEGAEVRVTLEGALMWKAVDGIVPVQGLSDARYGFWAEPPSIGDSK